MNAIEKDLTEFSKYSIFELLQFHWSYYAQIMDYRLHNEEVPSFYLYYVHCYAQVCLKKWKNNLPDFYFVRDKIEHQVGLFCPGFCNNAENFMEFLYGVRCVAENILRKSQKQRKCKMFFILNVYG